MTRRCVLLTIAFLALGGCCSPPPDPTTPGESKHAKRLGAWFEQLREGNDEEANALLRDAGPGPGITLEAFGRRADALGIRSVSSIEWTQVHYLDQEVEGPLGLIGRCLIENSAQLEAELTMPDGTHTFSAMWIPGEYGGLWRVNVDEKGLISFR